MIGFDDILLNSFPEDEDYVSECFARMQARQRTLYRSVNDLYGFGVNNEGLTPAQANGLINDLFNTFSGEWAVYILVGADGILDAIQNDTTLPWLDTDVNGAPLRQRIIERLQE